MPATASVQVRTLFAPFDRTTDEYLAFVKSAKTSLYLLIYGFHIPALTDCLIQKYTREGLRGGIILDHSQAEGKAEQTEVDKLLAAKVPMLIGTSPQHHQILHSKFTVVDGAAVESGSWNYSLSAGFQSNTLTFVSDADYAREYLEHWHRIHGFIVLNEATLQPQGETQAPDVPAAAITAAA